jgi:glycosyltransferase involved in cell wall biosynthesis
MIVKNESRVITRCLESVRTLVDYVLIEDTGSTDGTQQLIAEWLKRADMPGLVIEEPWRNFAYNRSHVLAKLRGVEGLDYALIIDADDQLMLDEGTDPVAFKAAMRDDLYDVQIRHNGSRFYRPQLCANKLPFYFKAVVHEYLEVPAGPISRSAAVGLYIETGSGGARSQNPKKYQDDAAILANALRTETDPFLISRYTFYLAQSYRDCGENKKALEHYLARAKLGFWTEEIFESLYSCGILMEKLKRPDAEIIGTYLEAYCYSPDRVESLQALVNYCHRTGKAPLGYLIGKHAITKSMPPNGLFVQRSVYDYAMLDDFAVAAYWVGEFRDCLDTCNKLLAGGKLPPEQRARVEANANWAKAKLLPVPGSGDLAPAASDRLDGAKEPSSSSSISKNSDHLVRVSCAAPANMGQATVFVVKPHNYTHWEAYRELSETVFYGLQKLGYYATMTSDVRAINGRPIVIGAHVASSELTTFLSDDAIIYNTEHVSWIESAGEFYKNMLLRYEVWDYSQDNAERLSKLLGKSVQFVKIGYVKELTRIESQSILDIDVLFLGSWKERRQAILDGLRQVGLRVHQAFGVYGRERDHLVARSKVVLNMHLYEPGIFEIVRVSYMLANRKAVVTEANPGEVLDDDLINGMVAVPYDQLVGAVSKLVQNDSRRVELEDAGFKAFTARDESRILKGMFHSRDARTGQPDITLKRWESGSATSVVNEKTAIV